MVFFDGNGMNASLLANNMLNGRQVLPCQPTMCDDDYTYHQTNIPLYDPCAKLCLTLQFPMPYRHLPALICKGLAQFFRNGN